MADTLLIHFDPATPDNATWALVNGAGELTSMLAHGELAETATIAEKNTTVVLLNHDALHIDAVNLPIKNRAKLLRALPYALEELLADDIDDMHFVAGLPQPGGLVPVAAIRHDSLKSIIETFHKAGIEPTAIIPDVLCSAANSAQWSVLLFENIARIQFDSFNGAGFDREVLPMVIAASLQSGKLPEPEKIVVFTADGDSSRDDFSAQLEKVIPEHIETLYVTYNSHPLVVFCGQYRNALSLNLLQETYKPTTRGKLEWQRWRLAASLALIWLCLALGSTGVQYIDLREKNNSLRVEIDKIYKTTFPESKKVVNARVQMEQKLNELKRGGNTAGGDSLIALLSDSASALASEKSVILQSINFRNQKLDLELTGSDLKTIESLNKKLNNNKIRSSIVSSSSEKDKVKGNIRIERSSS